MRGNNSSNFTLNSLPSKNYSYVEGGNIMKKKAIPVVVAIVGIVVIGGVYLFNHDKDEKEAESQQTAIEAEIDFAELLSGNGTEQAIKLPNSEEMVYIEGISQEEADALDKAFRQYEEVANTEVDTTNELAHLYTEMGPAIEAWFDPEIDTVADFKSVLHDTNETVAWLTQPLEQALEREDCANAFYYKEREGGGYTMSYGYYLVGYAHSSTWQLTQ